MNTDVLRLNTAELKDAAAKAKAAELVALIYSLDAEIAQKGKLLAEAKRSLILLRAPAEIAANFLAGTALCEAELVELRAACAGEYADAAGQIAAVVVPNEAATSYDLYPEEAYKAWLVAKGKKKGSVALARVWRAEREAAARELCGDSFKTLFDYLVAFAPTTGFADFAPKLLTPAKSRDLLTLCTAKKAVQAPHVKIERKKEE